MVSPYIERESLRVAMERALNRGRPVPLSDPIARSRAYDGAELTGWTDRDDQVATERALEWRQLYPAQEQSYALSRRLTAVSAIMAAMVVIAVLSSVMSAFAASGPAQPSHEGYFALASFVVVILFTVAALAGREQ